jgi:addiction module HigA family antidote
MNTHNPAHPGELLTGWLDDLGVTVTAFAAHIGISRVMLSRVLHGHAAVSADMDLRLSEALGTTPSVSAKIEPICFKSVHVSRTVLIYQWLLVFS